ncbi:LemA family protein [compost metagenome]
MSDELAGTENRIATERRRYNDTVREYNTFIKKFPQMLIARITGFDTEKYFEATKGAETVPKVDFK